MSGFGAASLRVRQLGFGFLVRKGPKFETGSTDSLKSRQGFPKTSAFGKTALNLHEKADFRPLFRKPFLKLTEFLEGLYIDRRYSHETDLSAQQSKAEPEIRVSGEDEDPGRAAYFKAPPGQRPD
jgi:hypothetical protein